MSLPEAIERRDPISPVLRLGSVLSDARRGAMSGLVQIRDRGRIHLIKVVEGSIADVMVDDSTMNSARRLDPLTMHSRAARLFELPRPHILWSPTPMGTRESELVDPVRVVLSGVTGRRDLFDPRRLVERIPVQTLSISLEMLPAVRRMPLTREEIGFLSRLTIPTPIPMILWKRGLDPRHAGALVVALNLVGIWEGEWEPGLLPRATSAVRISRGIEARLTDAELLGVNDGASEQEMDRAFRRLSLELHPDRLGGLPEGEARLAEEAFRGVSAAYDRLRRTRRSRPVRVSGGEPVARVPLSRRAPDNWQETLEEALRSERDGNRSRARAFALKTLGLSPPSHARELVLDLVSRVA
jgi:hypothetical protein